MTEAGSFSCLQFNSEIEIPTKWGHLAAKTWGSPDGMPVLALHGWQDNAGSFDNLAPLLPSSLYLVCLDFCGHGLSSPPAPGMFLNYYDHIYHIKLVIDHFKWKRVTIMGHSMGGITGIYFTAVFPELVERLISIDSIKQLSVPEEYVPDRMKYCMTKLQEMLVKMEQPPPTQSYEEVRARYVRAYNESITEEDADVLFRRGLKKSQHGGYYLSRDLRTTIKPYVFTDFSTEQLRSFARQISCPFMILKADQSTQFEKSELNNEFLELYSKTSKDFRFILVPGRHHVHLSNPSVVVAHIVNFLFPTKSKL